MPVCAQPWQHRLWLLLRQEEYPSPVPDRELQHLQRVICSDGVTSSRGIDLFYLPVAGEVNPTH